MIGGGFKYVLFSTLPGEMKTCYYFFSIGLKPTTRDVLFSIGYKALCLYTVVGISTTNFPINI